MTPDALLLSVPEVCRMLNIGKSLFYTMHSTGRLGPMPHKLGRRSLWNRQELIDWINAGMPARERWQTLKETRGGVA